MTCDPFTEFHSVPENRAHLPFPGKDLSPKQVPSSKQKTLILSWNWNPPRSSARACLPFRETVSAASGAAARASSDPRPGPSRAAQPGHLLLPRLSGPRPPRGGPGSVLAGRGPPPAVLAHRGRGAEDQRSVPAESPAALGAPAGGSRDPARVHVDRVKCSTLP